MDQSEWNPPPEWGRTPAEQVLRTLVKLSSPSSLLVFFIIIIVSWKLWGHDGHLSPPQSPLATPRRVSPPHRGPSSEDQRQVLQNGSVSLKRKILEEKQTQNKKRKAKIVAQIWIKWSYKFFKKGNETWEKIVIMMNEGEKKMLKNWLEKYTENKNKIKK